MVKVLKQVWLNSLEINWNIELKRVRNEVK